MPPKKSAAKKKEDAERQKRILATKEKILATKRMILSIIEVMIERDVSKEWLLTNCTKLCQADYNDVVAERSIEKICGYPMCSKIIKQTLKQKYHISRVTNKVYDLTERKCFCSNECYKASNYLRAQLSPIPLHMRKEEKMKIHLLSDNDNRGSAGEEIEFLYKIPKEEINKVYSEEINKSNNYQSMLNEEIKKCADSLGGLQIKEHIYESEYVFGDKSPEKSHDSVLDEQRDSDLDNTSDEDKEDERLFPSYDNLAVLSRGQMPIPEKVKRSVLIPPKRAEANIYSPAKELSLGFVHGVFKDWMTEDTLKFLMGEKYVYEVKADLLFEKMTDSANSRKLDSIKNEYIKLCLKIDSLPDDDDFSDSAEFDIVNESKKLQNESTLAKTSFKKRPKRSNKNKNVSFSSEIKNSRIIEKESLLSEKEKVEAVNQIEENMKQLSFDEKNAEITKYNCSNKDKREKEPPTEEDALSKPSFPLVDSVSQNVLRRQVLTGKLKSVYTELLPVAGLHYTDIREAVRKFVDSLSLTPTNIIFKPKEWKIISLVLFRVLTRTVLKDIHDELQFVKLCEEIPIEIDLREIEKLVCDIVSTEDIIL